MVLDMVRCRCHRAKEKEKEVERQDRHSVVRVVLGLSYSLHHSLFSVLCLSRTKVLQHTTNNNLKPSTPTALRQTMATRAANKRLTREYATISASPPEFISAHPSESNILEWHYILTGPPGTPYHGGQYWGTLNFPTDYPFAPPAIRMHTPSGRFRCSERLCLSISDFHPKSFNPAWEVSTILLGVLSFMTSEEMTTGSISGTEAERKVLARQSRWWNSTGGGSTDRSLEGTGVKSSNSRGFGAIKAGDGGKRFKEQWPEIDEENWKWMTEEKIDPQSGKKVMPEIELLKEDADGVVRRTVSEAQSKASRGRNVARQAANAVPESFFARNKYYLLGGVLFAYVIAARLLRSEEGY